jgi:hypothetical protein
MQRKSSDDQGTALYEVRETFEQGRTGILPGLWES